MASSITAMVQEAQAEYLRKRDANIAAVEAGKLAPYPDVPSSPSLWRNLTDLGLRPTFVDAAGNELQKPDR